MNMKLLAKVKLKVAKEVLLFQFVSRYAARCHASLCNLLLY